MERNSGPPPLTSPCEGENRWRRNEQAFSLAREVHESRRMQVDDACFGVTRQSSPSEVQTTRVAEWEAAFRENERAWGLGDI